MFTWRNLFQSVSPIEAILDRSNFTLKDLLDEDDVTQECKKQNKKLLEFLLKQENLEQLFNYVTQPSNPDDDDKETIKFPQVACDILSVDAFPIVDAILKRDDLVEKLLSFLSREPPLLEEQAGYCSRIIQSLLQRRTTQVLEILKHRNNFVKDVVSGLASTMTLDLLIKLIQMEETEEGAGIVEWLCEQKLLVHIIDLLGPEKTEDTHESASYSLGEIITAAAAAATPSPILLLLQTEEISSLYFQNIFASSTALLHGLPPLSALFSLLSASGYETTTTMDDLPALFHIVFESLPKFSSLLYPSGSSVLGQKKLRICEFILAFLHTNFACVMDRFTETDIFKPIVDLFFLHVWNSFLQHIVSEMLLFIFASPNNELKFHVISSTNLIPKIVQVEQENQKEMKETGVSRGYIGVLTKISTSLAFLASDEIEGDAHISKLILETPGWNEYVDSILAERRTKETGLLGGRKPDPLPPDRIDENGAVIPLSSVTLPTNNCFGGFGDFDDNGFDDDTSYSNKSSDFFMKHDNSDSDSDSNSDDDDDDVDDDTDSSDNEIVFKEGAEDSGLPWEQHRILDSEDTNRHDTSQDSQHIGVLSPDSPTDDSVSWSSEDAAHIPTGDSVSWSSEDAAHIPTPESNSGDTPEEGKKEEKEEESGNAEEAN